MKAIGYVRVSTERQAEFGASIEAQSERISAHCAGAGIELVRIEVDDGLSGKTLARPALQRALNALRDGVADMLVVAKLDRLSRSVRDVLGLVEDYFAEQPRKKTARKLHLKSCDAMIDTATPHGRLVLAVMASMAQWERETIAERTRAALEFLKRNGVILGTLAYGRRRDAKGPADRRMPVVPDAAERAAVTAAASLRREGASLRAIAARLNAAGHAPRRASRWSPSSVLSLVRAARPAIQRRELAPGETLEIAVPIERHAESKNSETTRRLTIARKMSVKNAVAAALLAAGHPPPLPCTVEIVLVQGRRGRTWDGDNATARAAGARDEIARWLGCDDREGCGVDRWTVATARAAAPAVIVRVKRPQETSGETKSSADA